MCGAEHSPPFDHQPGKIRITDFPFDGPKGDKATAFDILWSGAAFELHNIENSRAFYKLDRQAKSHELTEEQFVRSCFGLEFRAVQRTRRWYVEIFLPHLKKYNLPSNPDVWYCDWWGSADDIFALYWDKRGYPWVPYSQYYQELTGAVPAAPH
jgi:hypothetical protein